MINLASKRIKGKFLFCQGKRVKEDGPFFMRGEMRFTGFPISQLNPPQIRAELGLRLLNNYSAEVMVFVQTYLEIAELACIISPFFGGPRTSAVSAKTSSITTM